MELGPILRAMMRNKVGVFLLVLEVAITLAIVVNCLNMVTASRARLVIPTGLDEENILAISIQSPGATYDDDGFVYQVLLQDLESIRAQPGVIDATPIRPWPLQGGGSSTQLKPAGAEDSRLVRCPQYTVDEHFLTAMDLELAGGRPFAESDMPPPPVEGVTPAPASSNIMVTQDLADALFPDGNALGAEVTGPGGGTPDVIIGIVDYMFTPYDGGASGMETRILFYPGRPGSQNFIGYLVRTEPNSYEPLFTDIEERIGGTHTGRIISTQGLMEIKRGGQIQNQFLVRILSGIIALLLFVTSIGIFGMTSFAVARRTQQIGTRRALGARQLDIVRLFLVENWLTTSFGIALGLAFAFGINLVLIRFADNVTPLSLELVVIGVVLLWAVGVVSTLLPALRGARVTPAVASRAL